MNGKRAKWLRKLALNIVLAQGESGGVGFNQYNQESNCPSWEPAYVDKHRHDFEDPTKNDTHERMTDPEGTPLLGMFNNPGTIHHKHKVTLIYKHLKKMWKATSGKHELFQQLKQRGTKNELQRPPVQEVNNRSTPAVRSVGKQSQLQLA